MSTADIERKANTRRSLADILNVEFDPHAEWLRNKREDASLTLTALLHEAGISRAELARKLDWKPSRVSRALSGNENLTLNTLAEIISASGMDFDLLIRKPDACRAFQPWEKNRFDAEILWLHAELTSALDEAKELQSRARVTLASASELSRALFRRAHRAKQVTESMQATNESFYYSEECDAAIPCAA